MRRHARDSSRRDVATERKQFESWRHRARETARSRARVERDEERTVRVVCVERVDGGGFGRGDMRGV